MSTANTSGSDYVVPPNTQNSGANNGSGTATKISSTNLLGGVSVSRFNNEVFASTVIDNDSADKALSGGAFAFNSSLPVAKKYSVSLAGVSNNVLRSGAAQPGLLRGVHKRESIRTYKIATAIRLGKWNAYKGKFLNNQNQTVENPTSTNDSLATDNAAVVTRSNPGKLVFMSNNPEPTVKSYSVKTG